MRNIKVLVIVSINFYKFIKNNYNKNLYSKLDQLLLIFKIHINIF